MSIRAPMTPRAGILWLVAVVLASALAFWDYTHRSRPPGPSEGDARDAVEGGADPIDGADPHEDWVEVEVEE